MALAQKNITAYFNSLYCLYSGIRRLGHQKYHISVHSIMICFSLYIWQVVFFFECIFVKVAWLY